MSKEYFVAAFTVDRDKQKGYYYEFPTMFYKFKFRNNISLNKITNKILEYVRKKIYNKIKILPVENIEEYFENNIEIYVNHFQVKLYKFECW